MPKFKFYQNKQKVAELYIFMIISDQKCYPQKKGQAGETASAMSMFDKFIASGVVRKQVQFRRLQQISRDRGAQRELMNTH